MTIFMGVPPLKAIIRRNLNTFKYDLRVTRAEGGEPEDTNALYIETVRALLDQRPWD